MIFLVTKMRHFDCDDTKFWRTEVTIERPKIRRKNLPKKRILKNVVGAKHKFSKNHYLKAFSRAYALACTKIDKNKTLLNFSITKKNSRREGEGSAMLRNLSENCVLNPNVHEYEFFHRFL